MTEQDSLFLPLDEAIRELDEALRDLPDYDVWRRPDPRLLSVGELVSHLVYWEARSFLGDDPVSELDNPRARYYATNVAAPSHLAIAAADIMPEILRVHLACRQAFMSEPRDLEALSPLRGEWTWRYTLVYQGFHLAYHTGQIYSVRHLLGHATSDN
jgi:hypothetical protein